MFMCFVFKSISIGSVLDKVPIGKRTPGSRAIALDATENYYVEMRNKHIDTLRPAHSLARLELTA